MNNIEVTGGTKSQRLYSKSIAEYCCKMLMPKMSTLDIEIKIRRLLETVAHEMVHVKQYAKGELFEGNFKLGKHRWMGEWLSDNSNLVKEYWDHPWEVEAHGRECGLFVRWAEENKLGSRSWALDD